MNKNNADRKYLTYLAGVVFLLSLLPILYLAGIDRASGDDWGYGLLTHRAWMETHSCVSGSCFDSKKLLWQLAGNLVFYFPVYFTARGVFLRNVLDCTLYYAGTADRKCIQLSLSGDGALFPYGFAGLSFG